MHAWGAPGGEDGEDGKRADSREAKARNLAKISSFSEFSGAASTQPLCLSTPRGWSSVDVQAHSPQLVSGFSDTASTLWEGSMPSPL